MSIHFRISPDARLVCYGVDGDATPADGRAFLDEALAHPDFEWGFGFVGDRRRAADPNAEYIRAMAEEVRLRSGALAPCRWAVVVSSESAFGAVRMWAMLVERTGVEIAPFTNWERAAEWVLARERWKGSVRA